MECSLALLVVKDGFAVLERDGGQQFLFPLLSRMKWEGWVVVHQRCRRGCRRLFLVLCYRCGSMGEKLHDYTLNMVRAKLTPSQTCWSWRATLRDVRKREGTAGPQDVLLTPWPSLQTFYFSAISH